MLYIIFHIRDNEVTNSNVKHHIQVNNAIKTLYAGSTDKQSNETLDTIWSEYQTFNNKNDNVDNIEFIWSSKYICDGNIYLWNQKYS